MENGGEPWEKKKEARSGTFCCFTKKSFLCQGPWFQFSSYAVHYAAVDVLGNRREREGLDAMSYCMIKTEGEGLEARQDMREYRVRLIEALPQSCILSMGFTLGSPFLFSFDVIEIKLLGSCMEV